MVFSMDRFGKLLEYSWFGAIVFKSSTSVEKPPLNPPSSSSFVSCDHFTIDEDIEMGWVQVENQSSSNIAHQSTDCIPTSSNFQFERSVSSLSSSFQFERSVSFQLSIITVEENDWVMVDHPVTLPTSSPNPHFQPSPSVSSSSSTSNPSESSNQDTSILLQTSLSSPQTRRTLSSSDHASISSSSNMDPDQFASSAASSPSVASVSLSISSSVSSSSSSSEHVDDSPAQFSRISSSSSSTHAPSSTVSSTVSNPASTTPPRDVRRARKSSRAIIIMHSSFKWHEILLAISFTVPVGLLSATFKKVKGVLVPAELFTSNPTLFHIFIILDALAFTASVVGILLHALGKKKNKSCLSYLSLFAFTALVFAFAIYLSVLLPKLLVCIPYILLIILLLVLLYVGVSMYNRSCHKNHRVKSTSTLVTTTAAIV